MWEVRSSSEIVKCTSAMAALNIDGVFIIFGGISYENWWSTNLCEDNPFVFDNKFTLTR